MEGVQLEIREKLESVPPPMAITRKDGGVTVVVAEEGGGEKMSGKRESETELGESASKRRGKLSEGKIMSDDVCLNCKAGVLHFMGGDLLICGRRDCPKACHRCCSFHPKDDWFDPALVDGWICGWHECSYCFKQARYMCYTCANSYCKSCVNGKYFSCVRGSKGFCKRCMLNVVRIEKNELGNYLAENKSSFLCMIERNFEGYYLELRKKLSLSWDEIAMPKIPGKDDGSDSDDPMADVVTVRLEGRYLRDPLAYEEQERENERMRM